MKSEIEARLNELKKEYQKGQERMAALEQETTNLSHTLLRISGAIQVLEELSEVRAPGMTDGKYTNPENIPQNDNHVENSEA